MAKAGLLAILQTGVVKSANHAFAKPMWNATSFSNKSLSKGVNPKSESFFRRTSMAMTYLEKTCNPEPGPNKELQHGPYQL